MDVMGSLSLIVRTVSVDVKQHCRNNDTDTVVSALCLTRLQPSGTNSLFLSDILLLSVL